MKNYKAYSDEGLLKLLRQQELGAFDEIYMRYWKKLYSAAYKRVQSREVSEELVQDIFTSLWANREILKVEVLSAYLFSAIKYKVINHLEKELSRKLYQDVQLTVTPVENSTEDAVYLNELNQALEKEIQKLPPKRQEIFKLSRQHHLSIKQVASHLGISEKTAENQLGKALKVLKINLKQFNFFTLVIGSFLNASSGTW